MPVKSDVIRHAFGVMNTAGGVGDPVEGEDYAYADAVLVSLVDELATSEGITFTFSIEGTIPNKYMMPLARLLAHEIAGQFEGAAPGSRNGALMRLRAVHRPYSRDMDLNDDGTTEDEEIVVVDESRYY